MGNKSFLGTVLLTGALISASIFSEFSVSVHAAEAYQAEISAFEALDPSEYYFECPEGADISDIISNFPKSITAYDSTGSPMDISVQWECIYSDEHEQLYSPSFDESLYPLSDESLMLDIPRMQIRIKGADDDLQTLSSVTFDDLNDKEVFLKQEERGTCTLCAAAMLVRRAAMLDGNEDWNDVTESGMKSVAWLSGVGLYHNFTYAGISISSELIDINESFLKKFLDKHPEGIVIYNYNKPHAILVTDYDDDTFYCADPSNSTAKGRIAIEDASMGIKGSTRYWYVKSPKDLSYDKGSKKPSKKPVSGDNIVSDNKPSDPTTTNRGDFTINYNSKIPFNGKKLTIDNLGDITVSYSDREYKVEKVKVNKNTHTFQILALSGADKKLNKAIKKATKGSNQVIFYPKPYYVSDKDDIKVVFNKGGDVVKKVLIYFDDNTYKVKKNEYTYNRSEHAIIFDSGNLKGSVEIL